MDKGELLPQAITVKGQSSDAFKIAKTTILGFFFTIAVTVCVFFAVRYGSVASDAVQQCPVQPRSSLVQKADHSKLMDKDLNRERYLKMKNGRILHARFTYDLESNLIMVQTPGNISGDSPATLVIDYYQALVFARVHDEDFCLVYSLPDEFGKLLNEELSATDRDVIDVAYEVLYNASYVVTGEIPVGFVKSTSGPMVHGMCAGRITYWLDLVEKDRSNERKKRGGCPPVCRPPDSGGGGCPPVCSPPDPAPPRPRPPILVK